MLTNFKSFFQSIDRNNQQTKATGWSSGYSINVILSQMQIFFADPDMKLRLTPNQIIDLINYSKEYKCSGCKNKSQYRLKETKTANSLDDAKIIALKNNLICGLTKNSLFTNNEILLGYPILLKTARNGKLFPQILIEMLSYDGYIMHIQQQGISKLDNFEKTKMFSPNGDPYNYYIPIYINEDHFKRGFRLILNSISVIRHGIKGLKDNDFKPDMILSVLPCLINKTIVFILNGTIFHSLAAIQAYCHLLRLYYKFINYYPELKTKINNDVLKFKESYFNRHKNIIPDLGEFIINLFLSETKYNDIKNDLYIEFMTRQIFWIEKAESNIVESIPENRLMQTIFKHSKVANSLLMFNLMAAQYFISPEIILKTDQNYGFIPDDLMNEFKNVIIKIKNATSYDEFFDLIKINDFNNIESFKKMVVNCKSFAQNGRYI